MGLLSTLSPPHWLGESRPPHPPTPHWDDTLTACSLSEQVKLEELQPRLEATVAHSAWSLLECSTRQRAYGFSTASGGHDIQGLDLHWVHRDLVTCQAVSIENAF